ncbi:N-acetylglucosamine-6-phosphate deacetylase [Bacillus cereus]|uniref:N-acetylglucosamine-6-phosphate deacetylase n=1 Tax=Bacillus cereus TaxID=1396 RepID=UPI00065D11E3|nr:N-acetylglucosamine-6-phosphate deacetylase [Bacillus cereus]KMN69820.1 N-acetylglucosamine-6-phosphate deacetylase [Bacillus cereus]
MEYYIHSEKILFENTITGPGYLKIKDGKFGAFQKEKPNEEDVIIIDYEDKWIAPGLVDTHVHGILGHEVMDNSFEGLETISKGLLSCGVTSFLPTTLTAPIELLNDIVSMVGNYYKEVTGAKIQGIYLEGPFFTEKYKGAQNPKYFTDPSIAIFNNWQKLSGGIIKKIALAPERNNVKELVKKLTKNNVVVALGHSDGTYEQAKDVVEAGASVFTHTYNGMSPLNHREPGMVGAAMSLKNVFAELICDGYHVHPKAAEILMDMRGRESIALISDCMRAGGMPEGEYSLGEFSVKVKDGQARMETGNLAGSILTLKDAIKNVVEWEIATPEEAIKMASFVPAVSCKIENTCGIISEGRAADYIVLDDKMNLLETYVNGHCLYNISDIE